MNHSVEIVLYDPEWPFFFEQERTLILHALGANCLQVHHIGSTSVPYLSAKPIIDILPVVKNILHVDLCIPAMKDLGYETKGEFGIAFRRHFFKGEKRRTHNIHVYQEGNPEIERHLKFRDWMRSHKEDRNRYETLKKTLAFNFPNDVLNYTHGKETFIAEIETKIGFSGWRMVQALTDKEWKAVRSLRSSCSSVPPLTLSSSDIHFVFYNNTEVIGYAHLELKENLVLLKFFAIDFSHRLLGFGSFFLKLLATWAFQQKKALKTPSHPFFEQQGYV